MALRDVSNCNEFALKLPQGYAAIIGENGSELSGGERQRISIARALLKNDPIILLDEATASLDVENETKVQGALSRLLQGKTVLVIAHRMRTVEAGIQAVWDNYLKPAFSARGVTNEAHMLYYFQYFKAGVLSLLKRWLDQGCPEPPSEIAEMIVQLINR